MGTRRWIQIILLVVMVVAGLRVLLIYHGRHSTEPTKEQKAANAPLNPDYYVTPKKLHAYDLQSAKELTRQPAWVKEGYRYPYFPYEGGRTNSKHEAGKLGPIEKLKIVDVVLEKAPGETFMTPSGAKVKVAQHSLNAILEKDGKKYSVPIGIKRGGDYEIYADEMFYYQDPHELYKHWPSSVWQAIGKHEVKPGMSELQADFSVGVGYLENAGASQPRVLKYPNGGRPLVITYEDGKAIEVKTGQAES